MRNKPCFKPILIMILFIAFLAIANSSFAEGPTVPVMHAPVHAEVNEEFQFSFDAVDNAVSYQVRATFWGLNSGWGTVLYDYEVEAPESRIFAGESKGTYVFSVWAKDADGNQSEYAEKKVYIYEGPITKTVTLSTPYSETMYGTITLDYEANGADDIRIYRKLSRETEWHRARGSDPNEYTHYRTDLPDGINQYKLEADFGNETITSRIITVTRIPNTLGKLEKPVIEAPAQLNQGQDCTVSFYPVDYADSYSVTISAHKNQWWQTFYNETISADEVGEKWTYTIPADEFNSTNINVTMKVMAESHLTFDSSAETDIMYGQKPVLSMSQTSVAPGQSLSFSETVTGADGSSVRAALEKINYVASVWHTNSSYRNIDSYTASFTASANTTIEIDTSSLEEGIYRIIDSCGSSAEFTVCSGSVGLGIPTIKFRESPYYDVMISMYLNGADCFEYEINGIRKSTVYQAGNAETGYEGSEEGETITFRARGIRNNLPGPWSAVQTFEIPASPVIEYPELSATVANLSISQNEDLIVHVQNHESLSYMYIYCNYEDIGNLTGHYDYEPDSEGNVIIPGYLIDPGEYHLYTKLTDDNGNDVIVDFGTLNVTASPVNTSLTPTVSVVQGTNLLDSIVWFEASLNNATKFEWRQQNTTNRSAFNGGIVEQGVPSSRTQLFSNGRAVFCTTDDPDKFLGDPWKYMDSDNPYYLDNDRTIEVRGYVNGSWSNWTSCTYRLEYTDTLPEFSINAPDSIVIGDPFSISWEPVSGASYYYVFMETYGPDAGGETGKSGWIADTSYELDSAVFDFPNDYYIDVIAVGPGRITRCNLNNTLQVCPAAPELALLNAPLTSGVSAKISANTNSDNLFWGGFKPVEYEYRLTDPSGVSGEVVNLTEGRSSDQVDYYVKGDLQFHLPAAETVTTGTYTLQMRAKINGGWSPWSSLLFEVGESTASSFRCWNNTCWWSLTDGVLRISATGDADAAAAEWDPAEVRELIILDGVISVPDNAFGYHTALTSIYLPETCKTIGNTSFEFCGNLTRIHWPSQMNSIGAGAFRHCFLLDNVHVPEGITVIPSELFYACQTLKTVYFPSTLAQTNAAIFNGTGLTDVYYNGTESMWNQILGADRDEKLVAATKHFLGGGTITPTPTPAGPTPTPAPTSDPDTQFELDMPETLEIGNPLIISVDTDLTGQLTFNASVYTNDQQYVGNHYTKDNPIVIDEGVFEEAGTYSVRVSTYKTINGTNKMFSAVKTFVVTGTRAAAPAVTVVSEEIDKDTEAEFAIVRRGLTAIKYKKKIGNGIWLSNYNSAASNVTISGSIASWGETLSLDDDYVYYVFSARVNNVWTAYSEPVAVHCKAIDTLPVPTIVDPGTMEAGVPIYITINETDHADRYSMSLSGRSNGQSVSIYESYNTAGRVLIAPYGVDAGYYTLNLTAYGPGYRKNSSQYTIAVAGSCPEITVQLPEGPVHVGDIVHVKILAEDIECARLVSERDGQGTGFPLCYGNGESVEISLRINNKYSNSYAVRGKVNGKWSNPTGFTLTVVDIETEEYNPIIRVKSPYSRGMDIPVYIENYRDDLIFTYNVTWLGGEEPMNIVYELVIDELEDGFFYIPAYQFQFPGDYTITVDAYTSDVYNSYLGESTASVTILENDQLLDAPIVILLSDRVYPWSFAYFDVQVNGAEQLFVYEKRANEPHENEDPLVISLDGTETHYQFIRQIPSSEMIYYFAIVKNGRLSKLSGPLVVTPVSSEDIPDSDKLGPIHLEYPEEVNIGQDITVSWEAVAGAERYTLTVGNFGETFGPDTLSCIIPGSAFTRGGWEDLWFEADAINKERSILADGIWVNDIAAKPSVRAVSLTENKLLIEASNVVLDRIHLRINDQEDGYIISNPSEGRQRFVLNVAGYETLKIEARNEDSEGWTVSEWSEPLLVDFSEDDPLNFGSLRAFVDRCIAALYNRSSTEAETEEWTEQLTSGRLNATEMICQMLVDPEFTGRNLTNSTFIACLAQAMYNRAIDTQGCAYLMSLLNAGASRRAVVVVMAVMDTIMGEQEFSTLCAQQGIPYGLVSMNTLRLPSSLVRIESEAFSGTISVEAIRIPSSVTYIAPDAFAGYPVIFLFGEEGKVAQAYAAEHSNCVFVSNAFLN